MEKYIRKEPRVLKVVNREDNVVTLVDEIGSKVVITPKQLDEMYKQVQDSK